ncbi:hypothetical protein F6P93_10580 [Escherichia coli]|nr:hypothetical protein F6P93_10580 [Escherichia coli]
MNERSGVQHRPFDVPTYPPTIARCHIRPTQPIHGIQRPPYPHGSYHCGTGGGLARNLTIILEWKHRWVIVPCQYFWMMLDQQAEP